MYSHPAYTHMHTLKYGRRYSIILKWRVANAQIYQYIICVGYIALRSGHILIYRIHYFENHLIIAHSSFKVGALLAGQLYTTV